MMLVSLVLMQHLLRYQYSEGTVVQYDVRQSWETTDFEEMSVFTEQWKYTVAEMLNGGSSRMSVERLLVGMEIDDQTLTVGEGSPSITIENHSVRGDVRQKSRQPNETFMTWRLRRIGELFYPSKELAVGETWQRDLSMDESGGLPTANWKWTLDKVEDDKAYGRFSFTELKVERPIQAEGKFAVSLKDGWPHELSFKAVNTYQPGDQERLSTVYEFSMKRR